MNPRHSSAPKQAVVALLVLLLAGCTQSEWLLSFYYNRLDDRLLDSYTEYADFSEAQQQWIEARVDQFHFWHRHEMMHDYAELLGDAADRLHHSKPLTPATVSDFTHRLVGTMADIHKCSPITNAAPFFVTLSDEQVKQIEASLKRSIEEERERHGEWKNEDTFERVYKWLSRLGLDLTEAQKKAYREAHSRHHSLWAESIELEQSWNSQLVTLLRIRDKPGIQEAIGRHLYARRGLTKRAYPDQYNQNVNLWQRYALDLLNGLSRDQRENLVRTLKTHQRNLLAISQKGRRPANMPNEGTCGVAAPAR